MTPASPPPVAVRPPADAQSFGSEPDVQQRFTRGRETLAMRVLIVEDDRRLAATLRRGLSEEGFSVDLVEDGEEGVDAAGTTPFDAIVLDVMLPGRLDGFEVCRAIRDRRIRTPVLMLTALDEVDDRVTGLEAGADDYLVKPFAFRELLARLRALTRRHLDNRGAVLRVGEVEMDTSARTVRVRDAAVTFTAKEFAILEYLLHHHGQMLSREQIEDHVWNYDFASESNLVEVFVARIRRKLLAAGMADPITTVRGAGYRYESA